MIKKRLMYVIFLLVLFPSVYALNESVYSGKVYSGETINVSGEFYSFTLSKDNGKLAIAMPTGSGVIVKDGECEIRNYLNLCFNGAEEWYQNYSTDKMYYKASVVIIKIVSDLTLTRVVEENDILIGESTKVDVAITNGADREAADVVYSDIFPPSFAITDVTGCRVEKFNDSHNAVKWTGYLDKFGEKKCSYKLRALEEVKFKSKASLTYNNGVESKTVNSDSVTITVPEHQLDIVFNLGEKRIELGQDVDLNISLKNINAEKNIRVTLFELIIPTGLKIKTPPKYLKQDYKKLNWKGSILKNESMDFSIRLKGEYIGKHNFTPGVVFIIDEIRKEIGKSTILEVYFSDLVMNYEIDKDVLKKDDKANIAIRVRNPNRVHTFRSTKITIESTLPDFEKVTQNLGRLKPLESKVSEISFTAPDIDTDTVYPLDITVSYETEYNQVLKLKQERTVVVLGKEGTVTEEAVHVVDEIGVTEESGAVKEPEPEEPVEALPEEVIVLDEEPESKGLPNMVLIIVSLITVFTVFMVVGIVTLKGKLKERKEKQKLVGEIKKEDTTSFPKQ